ncbi:hypothetical protein K1T71_003448 [Dendrolimus kikuchii]|uniref:Uncharacterized protein n=1 Tax=Dendrolimus kikuchii TaxID=765133 RepID=A0ACC1DCM4_9NEOP|nr:hypothetical protein K1T71_003448 [Dendrolimus kikuchii]
MSESKKFGMDDILTKAEQEHLNSLKIKVEDGTTRCMVERKAKDNFGKWVYYCYPCGATCISRNVLKQHIYGKKHMKRLSQYAIWPTSIFNQASEKDFNRFAEALDINDKKPKSLHEKYEKLRKATSHIQKILDEIKPKDYEKLRFEPYPRRDLSPTSSRNANSEKKKSPNYKYKIQLAKEKCETIQNAMKKTYTYFKKYPEQHPMYAEEWSQFWKRRKKEILSKGIDPSKHDFKSEWGVFWMDRMNELHKEKLRVQEMEVYRELCVSPLATMCLDEKQISPAPERKASKGIEWQLEPMQGSLEQKGSHIQSPRSAHVRILEARRAPLDDRRRSLEIRQWEAKRRSLERSMSPIRKPRAPDVRRAEAKRRSPDIKRPEARRRSPDRQWSPEHRCHSPYLCPRSSDRRNIILDYDEECPMIRRRASHRSAPWSDRSRSRSPIQRDYDSGVNSAGSSVGGMRPRASGARDKSAAALRLVQALEDCFGSDGSKVVDLLARAIDMNNEKANSSEEQLEQRASASKVVATRQETNDFKLSTQRPPVEQVARAEIAQQVTEALVSRGKTNVSTKELTQIVDTIAAMAEAKRRAIDITYNLTDSDLEMLLKNFNELSVEEQGKVIEFIEGLVVKEPARVERLSRCLSTVTSIKNNKGPKSTGILDVNTNCDADEHDPIVKEITKVLDEVPITLFDTLSCP